MLGCTCGPRVSAPAAIHARFVLGDYCRREKKRSGLTEEGAVERAARAVSKKRDHCFRLDAAVNCRRGKNWLRSSLGSAEMRVINGGADWLHAAAVRW